MNNEEAMISELEREIDKLKKENEELKRELKKTQELLRTARDSNRRSEHLIEIIGTLCENC